LRETRRGLASTRQATRVGPPGPRVPRRTARLIRGGDAPIRCSDRSGAARTSRPHRAAWSRLGGFRHPMNTRRGRAPGFKRRPLPAADPEVAIRGKRRARGGRVEPLTVCGSCRLSSVLTTSKGLQTSLLGTRAGLARRPVSAECPQRQTHLPTGPTKKTCKCRSSRERLKGFEPSTFCMAIRGWGRRLPGNCLENGGFGALCADGGALRIHTVSRGFCQ
jgi:hypothetical protein